MLLSCMYIPLSTVGYWQWISGYIHYLHIVKHLSYTCIALWREHVFKAVANFCGKGGDSCQVDITTQPTTQVYCIHYTQHINKGRTLLREKRQFNVDGIPEFWIWWHPPEKQMSKMSCLKKKDYISPIS